MPNEFISWLNGAPVIGSELNDDFDFWLKGAPVADLEAPSTVLANVNVTLDALTSSSTASVLVRANASITLGALTSSSNTSVVVTANSSNTLGALSLNSLTSVVVRADASITLGALTSSSATTVVIGASLTQTLGGLTSDSAAIVVVTGNLSATLGALSLSATGIVADAIHADLNVTLGAMTVVGLIIRGPEPFFLISDTDLYNATRTGLLYFEYQKVPYDPEITATCASSFQELERIISLMQDTPLMKSWLLVPAGDLITRPARVSIDDMKKLRRQWLPVDSTPIFPAV